MRRTVAGVLSGALLVAGLAIGAPGAAVAASPGAMAGVPVLVGHGPSPAAATPAAVTVHRDQATGVVRGKVYFPFGSTRVEPAQRRTLRGIVGQLPPGSVVTVRVTGYVRASGATRADRQRALRRAEAVRRQLVRLGVDRAAIRVSNDGRSNTTTFRARRVNVRLTWRLPASDQAPQPPATPAPTPPPSDPPVSPPPVDTAQVAPQLTTTPGTLDYREGVGALPIDPGLVVVDPDSQIAGATVAIDSGFTASEDVLVFTSLQGISGSFEAPTGVLTLAGSAPVAVYQAALRSVRYLLTSDAPSTQPRSFTFRVTDTTGRASGSASRAATVAATNDPGVVTTSPGSQAFTEDGPAVPVDAALAVADPDDTALEAATVAISSGRQAGDELGFVDQSGITGSFDSATGVLALTGTAAVADYQAALRSVTFGHVGDQPESSRTLRFQVDDGDGPGPVATRGVEVVAVDDGTVAQPDSYSAVGNTTLVVGGTRPPGQAGLVVAGSLLANDADADGPLVAQAGTFPTGLGGAITVAQDGTFAYRPPAGQTGTQDTVLYRACDRTPCTESTPGTGTALVTFDLVGQVWYVRNDAAAPGAGTAAAPFSTLAGAEAASGAGDTVYVLAGDGTSAGLDSGFVMEADQRLVGERRGLALDPDGPAGLPTVELHPAAPAARPVLTALDEDVVVLAPGAVVEGVAIDPTGSGGGISGTGPGAAAITDVVIADQGTPGSQPGLDLTGRGAATTTVTDLTVTTAGATGVRLASAGTVTFDPPSTVAITTTGAAALDVTRTDLATSAFDAITVTGSSTGAVRLATTTGATTFGNLALTTVGGTSAALELIEAGTITVLDAAVVSISATGGPAVDVIGTAAWLALDQVNSTNSVGDGINLASVGAGSITAPAGTISGAAGVAVDIEGDNGTITFGGRIDDGPGTSVEVTGRTGGTVTLGGRITDGADQGGGIRVTGNTGGSTVLTGGASGPTPGSITIRSGSADAVAMTASDGHTLRFASAGLDVGAGAGAGLRADASGTLEVTGPGNRITTATGRALGITSTDIGADDVTFEAISANGAANGIVLDTTGAAGSLVVTGAGGTCTAASPGTCTGGRIQGTVGADDAGATPAGAGIVLRSTAAPSLSRMWIHDHSNYAIRGTGVAGLALADSVISGANGTTSAAPYADGSVVLEQLTGAASITRTAISGAVTDELRVVNTSGILNRLTVSQATFGTGAAGTGGDAVRLVSTGTATLHATIERSTFLRAAGAQVLSSHQGAGTSDLLVDASTFTNGHASVLPGGGGLVLEAGATGSSTLTVRNNTISGAVGAAIRVDKAAGASQQAGTISGNTIGVPTVSGSGSAEGSGIRVGSNGSGSSRWIVANNRVHQYNRFGIEVALLETGNKTGSGDDLAVAVTGNAVANPGAQAFRGIDVTAGALAADSQQLCVDLRGNALAASATGGRQEVSLRQREGTTVRLPGYQGGSRDGTAVANYVASLQSPPSTVLAQPEASTGGGFTGGAACPLP